MKTQRMLKVALGSLLSLAVLLIAWAAHGQPASAPASLPTVLPLDNPGALLQLLLDAWGAHNWPVIITGACILILAVERHFKGLTGNRFSMWLGTKLGMFVSSLFTALVTAAASVAFQGWKAIGAACGAAAFAALVNLGVQFAGPATKAQG
jgi:hypothetical protein